MRYRRLEQVTTPAKFFTATAGRLKETSNDHHGKLDDGEDQPAGQLYAFQHVR